ncbi:recombinase family protein [Candidatus Falkowbacteria bacterium]|nr:recombinase family protein [Candidatus Falkowbacteria bacterium]
MKKAVLYARVSSSMQEKERTIESQIAELKRQIRANGDVLIKEYVDDGHSGAVLDRPAMNELRNDLKKNIFETIYILNTDRIARDVTYQNIIIGEFLQYKKQIIINGKDYVNNPENKFTLTVLGAVAELERAKYIERTNRGKQHRLKQGNLLSMGCHIYGYTYIRRTETAFPSYHINKQEAEVIKLIFQTYAEHETSIRILSENLKEMKIQARNKFGFSQLKYILKNETYTGTKYFNTMTDQDGPRVYRNHRGKMVSRDRSEWIGIKIPQIIPKELFDKVQKRLKHNEDCYRNSKRKYLLSGLLWCGECNIRAFAFRRYYVAERKEGNKIYQKASYRCKMKGLPHNPEIDTRILESCVMEMIKDTMINPTNLKECIGILKNKGRSDQAKTKRLLNAIDKKIWSIGQQKERIIDLYSSGDLGREEYVNKATPYDLEINELKAKRSDLIKHTTLLEKPEIINASINTYCEKAKSQFNICNDFSSKRQFLLDYADKITFQQHAIGVDKVRLWGSVPIKLPDQLDEKIKIEFKIEKLINRAEMNAKIRELEFKNGIRKSGEIPSAQFGNLKTANAPELKCI